MEWLDRSSFVTVWMSRSQNQTWIHQCRVSDAQCHEVIAAWPSLHRSATKIKPLPLHADSSGGGVGESLAPTARPVLDGQRVHARLAHGRIDGRPAIDLSAPAPLQGGVDRRFAISRPQSGRLGRDEQTDVSEKSAIRCCPFAN